MTCSVSLQPGMMCRRGDGCGRRNGVTLCDRGLFAHEGAKAVPPQKRTHVPLSALVGTSWLVVAFKPFQKPASPVNVCCDRGFLQPGRTQLMLEAEELCTELCRRIAVAASRGYR
jgi:hypothetical protein